MAMARIIRPEDLQCRLSACYETVAGQPADCNQQQLLVLLSGRLYLRLCKEIVDEIEALERRQETDSNGNTSYMQEQITKKHQQKQQPDDDFTTQAFLHFVNSRGYSFPSPLQEDALESISMKRTILFFLLVDLQAARLRCRCRLVAHLLPSVSATDAESSKECADIAVTNRKTYDKVAAALTEICACAGIPQSQPNSPTSSSLATDFAKAYEVFSQQSAQQLQKAAAERMLLPLPLPGDAEQQKCLLQQLQQMTATLNDQYLLRRKAMLRRLDVLVQAFLWSRRAEVYEEEFAVLLQEAEGWKRSDVEDRHVDLYDVFAAEKSLLLKNFGRGAAASQQKQQQQQRLSIKTLMIGPVPQRGGLPEGYSARAISADVRKANESMRAKDNVSRENSNSSSKNHFGRSSGASSRPHTAAAAAFAAPTSALGVSSNFTRLPLDAAAGGGLGASTGPPRRYISGRQQQPREAFQQQHQQYQQSFARQSSSQPQSLNQQQQFYHSQQRLFDENNTSSGKEAEGKLLNMNRGGGWRGGSRGRGGRRGAAGAGGGFGGRAGDRPPTWSPAT